MIKGLKKLKNKFEEEPIAVLLVGSLAAFAAANLIDSVTASRLNHRVVRQVEYQVRNN